MTDATQVGYYQWLDFNNPMTDKTANQLVAAVAKAPPTQVLDVGCGWAELLLRILQACPEATGHGVDHDDALLDRARRNATDRGLADRVSFSPALGDQDPVDLVVNIGAEHVFGTIDQALQELWSLVEPGGRLLLGTQIWERPPTPEVLEFIGQVPTLSELVDGAVDYGWRPLGLTVASAEDWDHFEFGFLNDWEQVVMAPNSSAEADRARRAADEHRSAYLERRGVLGFAFLTLGRPQEPTAD